MKVMHVMEATIGGTRRHLHDVAIGQRELGLDVVVVASARRMPEVRRDFERMAASGVSVVELPMVREISPRMDWKHTQELHKLLRSHRPDVVHTHSSKAGVLGRVASLVAGVGRRVHTPHTFAFLFAAMFSPAKRQLFRRVEVSLGRRTDRIVAVSESEAATIRASRVVPFDRIRVVQNGIDPRPWQGALPAERQALGVPPSVPLAAVVGLLNVAKGQDVLLRAMALPPARELHLLVCGHGEEEPALRELAKSLGIESRVRFLGWRTDVPQLLKASDLLVLPSRWEGMPYIVLEAMAAGLPVVATRVDGARELVQEGDTGFLAEPEDPSDLARALGLALARTGPERRAMGERGRELQGAQYGASQMVQRLMALYEELLP